MGKFDEIWGKAYPQYQEDAAIELGHNPNAKPGDEEATAWFRNPKTGNYDLPSSEDYLKTVANQLKMGPTPLPADFVGFLNSCAKQFGPQFPDVIVYDQLDQKTINSLNTRFPNFFITSVVQVKNPNTGKPIGVWGVFKPSSNATVAYDNTRIMKRLDVALKEGNGPFSIGNSFLGSLYGAAGNAISKGVGKLFPGKGQSAVQATQQAAPQEGQPAPTAQPQQSQAQSPGISVAGVSAGPEEYKKVDQLVQALQTAFGNTPQKESLSPETLEFVKSYGLEKLFEANIQAGVNDILTFLRTIKGKTSSQSWSVQDFQNLSTLLSSPDVQTAMKQKKVNSTLTKADFQILSQTATQAEGAAQGNRQAQIIRSSKDPRVVAAGYTDLFKKLAQDPKAKGEAVNLWKANNQSTDLTTWSITDLQAIDNLASAFLGQGQAINAAMVKQAKDPNATLTGKPAQQPATPQAQQAAQAAAHPTAPVPAPSNTAATALIKKYAKDHILSNTDRLAFSRVLKLLQKG